MKYPVKSRVIIHLHQRNEGVKSLVNAVDSFNRQHGAPLKFVSLEDHLKGEVPAKVLKGIYTGALTSEIKPDLLYPSIGVIWMPTLEQGDWAARLKSPFGIEGSYEGLIVEVINKENERVDPDNADFAYDVHDLGYAREIFYELFARFNVIPIPQSL